MATFTHTTSILEVTPRAWADIRAALNKALAGQSLGYHPVGEDVIDMSGILLRASLSAPMAGEDAPAMQPVATPKTRRLLQPWVDELPLQQQAVLVLACRGPDGYEKMHPCKDVIRAIRGCVMLAAYYGRSLTLNDRDDLFMRVGPITRETSAGEWDAVVSNWSHANDGYPIHFFQHVMQAANVLRFQHSEPIVRTRFGQLYTACCEYVHCPEESRASFDARLSDWQQKGWGG